MTTREIEENIELEVDELTYSQLNKLLYLGEIDSITYYECREELDRKSKENSLFYKIKQKYKKIFKKVEV